jgi:hypothetical protein
VDQGGGTRKGVTGQRGMARDHADPFLNNPCGGVRALLQYAHLRQFAEKGVLIDTLEVEAPKHIHGTAIGRNELVLWRDLHPACTVGNPTLEGVITPQGT